MDQQAIGRLATDLWKDAFIKKLKDLPNSERLSEFIILFIKFSISFFNMFLFTYSGSGRFPAYGTGRNVAQEQQRCYG